MRYAACVGLTIGLGTTPGVAGPPEHNLGFALGAGLAVAPIPGLQLEGAVHIENRVSVGGHIVDSGESYDAAIDIRLFASREGLRPYFATGFGALNIGTRFERFVTIGGGVEYRYHDGFAWAGELAYEHATRATEATPSGSQRVAAGPRACAFAGVRFYF